MSVSLDETDGLMEPVSVEGEAFIYANRWVPEDAPGASKVAAEYSGYLVPNYTASVGSGRIPGSPYRDVSEESRPMPRRAVFRVPDGTGVPLDVGRLRYPW